MNMFWTGFEKRALSGDEHLDAVQKHFESMGKQDKAELSAASVHDPIGHGMHTFYQMRHWHLIDQHRKGLGSAHDLAKDHIAKVSKLPLEKHDVESLHKAGIVNKDLGYGY